MWHSTIGVVPCSDSETSTAVRTPSYSALRSDQNVAVSRVSTRTPASRKESRRYGPSKRPAAHAAPVSAPSGRPPTSRTVSYTHLRAHETDSYLVCRLLLEKKKNT